jgi:tRNA-specific 2-thiouridylase
MPKTDGHANAQELIVVAMSGGVDSSVTAALLAHQGFKVAGITLQLYDHGAALRRKSGCCAGQDIYDARRVAEKLGIPHYVLDFESRFKSAVIEDFVQSYETGFTPIPCVRCNQRVKFRDLLGIARDLGAGALATGHYAQRVMGKGGAELHRARDRGRDQSYFLFATTGPQLEYLRFPLGNLLKEEVRQKARELDLPVAAKPDSQDICFVPEGNYAQTIERLKPGAFKPGDIVDLEGRILGRHQGIVRYTIGQRRGVGGGRVEPYYVVKLDAEKAQVVVGPKAALLCRRLRLREVNWLAEDAGDVKAEIRLRSMQEPVPARIHLLADGTADVELELAQAGVAPGQAGVIYRGERVLGGGWIAATQQSAMAA